MDAAAAAGAVVLEKLKVGSVGEHWTGQSSAVGFYADACLAISLRVAGKDGIGAALQVFPRVLV